jgi:hypothetical protein
MRRTRGVRLFDDGVAIDDDDATVRAVSRDVVEIQLGHCSSGSVAREITDGHALGLDITLLEGTREAFLLVLTERESFFILRVPSVAFGPS